MSEDPTNKRVVVVTGAASGIGLAIAQHLESAGWIVAALDRSWSSPSSVGHGYEVDVTDEAQVVETLQAIDDELGPIRGAVTSAGVFLFADPVDITADQFRTVIDVNLTGTFLVAREAARAMRRHGGGSIVTVSSVSGLLTAPGRAAYASSKGGVMALTRSLAVDLAASGIRVNSIAPGLVHTPLFDANHSPELRDARLTTVPMGRLGEPHEIASVAEFLLGDRSSFVTGQTWAVDGGVSIQSK
jgi:NAD(P)-dependent dehydrogenase (short-subunit alcohol dehydrogenase family)